MSSKIGSPRAIRLKEHNPNLSRSLVPADVFIEKADATLLPGPFLLRTDSDGFILTGNDIISGHKVALIGGSFVESSFCHEGQRFIDQAERLLQGHRLLNGGYSGSTTLQLFNVMVSKIFPIIGNEGNLIFFVGQSDADVYNRQGSYWTDERLWSPIVPGFVPHDSLPNGTEAIRQVLQLVIEAAKIFGIRLTLAASPFRNGDFSWDQVLRKQFRRNREAYNANYKVRESIRHMAAKLAQENRVDFIDFQEITNGNPEWFYDDLHLNARGHEEFSRILAKEISQRTTSI